MQPRLMVLQLHLFMALRCIGVKELSLIPDKLYSTRSAFKLSEPSSFKLLTQYICILVRISCIEIKGDKVPEIITMDSQYRYSFCSIVSLAAVCNERCNQYI